MRARTLIAAALTIGGWVAACSKPTSEIGQDQSRVAADSGREMLPPAPAGSQATVSDLEAGVPPQLPLHPRAGRSKPDPRLASTAPAASAVTAVDLVPALTTTTTSMATVPLRLASAPMAAAPAAGAGQQSGGEAAGADSGPDTRVIIRGGTGSLNDPCAKHGPRAFGPPIAINNRMPPLGGGVLVNDRSPRYGGTGRGGTPSFRPRGIR